MSDTEDTKVEDIVEDKDQDADENGTKDQEDGNPEEFEYTDEPIGTYAEIPEEEPEVLGPPNALEKKIIKQVEYYFSDINLTKDRFLQDQIRDDPDGWVSIAVLTKFNRLKALTSNLKMIGTALKKSDSGLLQVSKDGVYTRRNPDLTLPKNTVELRTELNKKTVYCKGFPLNISLDKLISFFENNHGHVETVFMRRNPDRKFKGSVYVTFHSQEDADKFNNAEEVKYEDIVLEKMPKDEHTKIHDEMKQKKREERAEKKLEEKKIREEEERKKTIENMTKGALIRLEDVPESVGMDDIKSYFNAFSPVAWVEFKAGKPELPVYVRFGEADKAAEALKAAQEANEEGKVMLKGSEVKAYVPDEEEEIKYWIKFFRDALIRASKKRKQRFDHRKGPKRRRH